MYAAITVHTERARTKSKWTSETHERTVCCGFKMTLALNDNQSVSVQCKASSFNLFSDLKGFFLERFLKNRLHFAVHH